jgi:hypothetical protein
MLNLYFKNFYNIPLYVPIFCCSDLCHFDSCLCYYQMISRMLEGTLKMIDAKDLYHLPT